MADNPVLKYNGKEPTSQMLVELWTNAEKRMSHRTDRIVKCQSLRRFTEKVVINADFLKEHPEVNAEVAVSVLPEREGYERDLITKAGSVEPVISRQPLDVTDTAYDHAEEYESYMRDVAADPDSGIPFQTCIEKGTEDGEYGGVALPADLDSDGMPDFYDRLTERALAALSDEKRKEYEKDDNDRRGRYVRKDEQGNRKPNPAYDRDAKGRKRVDVEKAGSKESFERDKDKSKQAHEDAVRRYLLQHSASTFRVIPALDCYPLLGRGRGKARWSVEGIIERSLLEKEELVERKMGWAMTGDKLLLPKGSSRTHAGHNGGFYLYTAYLSLRDEDGIEHPSILYTVGGAATWWDGTAQYDKDMDNKVAVIDLYDERKLTGRFWHYEFGSHTSDDDPDYYGRPALWSFRQRILNIEGLETAAQVVVALEAYSGHYYKPDEKLMAIDPEAVIERETHTLRRPKKPGPGSIEPWAGDVMKFEQARIGDDAWRLQANYQQSLAQGMAVDSQTNSESGHAMLVQSSQGQIAKRHVRDAALRMYKFFLECDAMIRLGAYKCHEVKWPILTTEERPVGHEVRSRAKPVEFNPDWLGDDENPRLTVTYGEEFNLARADLEMAAADRGYRALKHVAAAFGEPDEMNLRVAIAKDQLWKSPESQMLLTEMVTQMRGMKRQRRAMMLQSQQRMTGQGLPGAELGLPSSMLKRAGEQAAGGGKPNMGASVRGGVKAAEMTGAAMQLNAEAQLGAA